MPALESHCGVLAGDVYIEMRNAYLVRGQIFEQGNGGVQEVD